MNNDKENKETPENPMPPVSYHVTDSYVTAIIGGKGKETEQPAGIAGFWDLIPNAQKDALVREQVIDLLKTDATAPDFLVNAIQDKENEELVPMLLSLCWESALDMSKHLDYFITLATATNDPLVMIELQTIIQDVNPGEEKKNQAVRSLEQGLLVKTDPLVKEIMNDLIYFLKS